MREGDRLNLTCVVEAGLPRPQVSWYKNKIILVDEESTNSILEEVSVKDEGAYMCEARNLGGVANAIINVTIDGKSNEVLAFLPRNIYELPKRIFLVKNAFYCSSFQGNKNQSEIKEWAVAMGSCNNYCIY